MARDPSSRPASAAAFAELLRAPGPAARPLAVVRTARPRSRRRRLLVALVLVAAALAALPAFAGGQLPWVGEGALAPFAVIGPGGDPPAAGETTQPAGEADRRAGEADPPAGLDPGDGDDHDGDDDDGSSGSGRSGGGGGSGPG
jgi:hypothetical protein